MRCGPLVASPLTRPAAQDIYTLFHLNRDFKFISKTSNFLIPIIGWSMYLTGHVMINRVDRRSQLKCLSDCAALLAVGAAVDDDDEGVFGIGRSV